MSLDVCIKFKKPRQENYFLSHPYIYNGLTDYDKECYYEEVCWAANITHNLGKMASRVTIGTGGADTTLYMVCWRPEEIFERPTTDLILPALIQGIEYMIEHRKELLQYNSPNGWGTYEGFMKFLLNYKQACEDNPDCEIEVGR